VKTIIGWREMVFFPDISEFPMKAKIDTGAKTSALHAFNIETFTKRKVDYVAFDILPHQRSKKNMTRVVAPLIEYRNVKSSVGTETRRPVILTNVVVAGRHFLTEVTLVNRDMMGFRLLLGREALSKRFIVDVSHSFLSYPKDIKRFKEEIE
jgi:hypothetical protein